MSGFGVGSLSGLLVSGIVLGALSLSSPLPPRADAETPEQDVPELEVTVSGDGVEAEAAEGEAVESEAPEPAVEAPTEDAPAEEGAPDAAPEEDAVPEEVAPEDGEAAAEESEESGNAAPATDVPLPSGSEFNRPPPEETAVLPAPDAAPNDAAPQAPQIAVQATEPSFDTAPAARPAVAAQAPSGIVSAPALRDLTSVTSSRADSDPVAVVPRTLTQPSAAVEPQIETASAPLPEVEPPVTPVVADAPDVPAEDATPSADIVALDAAEPETPSLAAPSFPVIAGAAGAEVSVQAPADAATPRLPQITRLPQVGDSAVPQVEEGADMPEGALDAAADEPPAENLPAIEAFATPFDLSEDRPLMAVVLIDDPESTLDLEALTRFTFPVAFAVDALHPDADVRAEAYRAAGFEVVMLGSMLIDGATAADTEVAMAGAQAVLPEAVALLDTPDHRIQGDRVVLDATIGALAQSGHGLLAFPRGLNAAEQSAARAGVPGATVFRLLDGEDQRATQITRLLTRAAFAASEDGGVVVVGHTRPDTVTALFSWALGDRSEAVALAPVSAVLMQSAGE